MAIQDSDAFLVARSGTNYQTPATDIMAIEDTDLLVVNRGGTNYKVTGQELKVYAGGGPAASNITGVVLDRDPNTAAVGGQPGALLILSSPGVLVSSDGATFTQLTTSGLNGSYYYGKTPTNESLFAYNTGGVNPREALAKVNPTTGVVTNLNSYSLDGGATIMQNASDPDGQWFISISGSGLKQIMVTNVVDNTTRAAVLPAPGGVSNRTMNYSNFDNLWYTTDNAGLIYTLSDPENPVAISTGLTAPTNNSSNVFRAESGAFYAYGGSNVVSTSTDGGVTWKSVTLSQSIQWASTDGFNRVWFMGTLSAYYSEDATKFYKKSSPFTPGWLETNQMSPTITGGGYNTFVDDLCLNVVVRGSLGDRVQGIFYYNFSLPDNPLIAT